LTTVTRPCAYLDPRQRVRCTECGMTVDLCTCVNVSEMAQERLHSPEGQFLRAVAAELGQFPNPKYRFETLVQLVGDLGIKLVNNAAINTPAPPDIYQHIAKIAAIAVLLGSGGTDEYPYEPA
jgi:hypothetical protein